MAALATSDDVVTVLGRALTDDESARVGAELDKASAFIRAETRRPFDATEVTVSRKVRDNGTVLLVDADTVSAVVEVDCDGDATTLDAADWTQRGSKVYGLTPRRWVEVTHTRDATVPAELVDLCAQIATVGLASDVKPGVESQTVTKGPFSESYTFRDGATSSLLSADQVAVLRRHSRPKIGSVPLL